MNKIGLWTFLAVLCLFCVAPAMAVPVNRKAPATPAKHKSGKAGIKGRPAPSVRGTTVQMVHVPAGSFLMGNSGTGDDATYGQSSEHPQHRVYLSGYWIGKYDVTRGQYRKFMKAGGYSHRAYWSAAGWAWRTAEKRAHPDYWEPGQKWGGAAFTQDDSFPVVGVNYYEAQAYCKWAGGHLPTEAQWEKAARWDGHPRIYPWGNTWDVEKCNNSLDTNPAGGGYDAYQDAPVGSYPSGTSSYGCEGMTGNVSQWCCDWYGPNYYSQEPSGGWVNPHGPSSSPTDPPERVVRGGSWDETYGGSGGGGGVFRCAARLGYHPDDNCDFGGFRLAR